MEAKTVAPAAVLQDQGRGDRESDFGNNESKRSGKLDQEAFRWRALSLHLGRRSKPVLTLKPDETYPHLYRIKYPNGWISAAANLTRAKDAAYGHARYLLGRLTPVEGVYSPEGQLDIGREAA